MLALPSDKAWRVAAGVGRFLSYAGLLLAAGGIVFLTVVDRRRPSKAVAKLIVGVAAIGVFGLLVQIPLQAAIATETGWHALLSPSRWIDVLSNTGFRWSTILGIVGAAFVAATVWAAWPAWVGVAGASVAFVSFTLTGHSRSTNPEWLVIPADTVHVAAAGVWFGGVVLLILTWRQQRGDGDAVGAGAACRSLLADGDRDGRRGRRDRRVPGVEGSRLAARADLDPLRLHTRRQAGGRRVRRSARGVQPLATRARHPPHGQASW